MDHFTRNELSELRECVDGYEEYMKKEHPVEYKLRALLNQIFYKLNSKVIIDLTDRQSYLYHDCSISELATMYFDFVLKYFNYRLPICDNLTNIHMRKDKIENILQNYNEIVLRNSKLWINNLDKTWIRYCYNLWIEPPIKKIKNIKRNAPLNTRFSDYEPDLLSDDHSSDSEQYTTRDQYFYRMIDIKPSFYTFMNCLKKSSMFVQKDCLKIIFDEVMGKEKEYWYYATTTNKCKSIIKYGLSNDGHDSIWHFTITNNYNEATKLAKIKANDVHKPAIIVFKIDDLFGEFDIVDNGEFEHGNHGWTVTSDKNETEIRMVFPSQLDSHIVGVYC